jgi:hypothetical protein
MAVATAGPRKIVATVDVEAAAEAPLAGTTLEYHQGHLLTSVEVVTIFWGQDWSVASQAQIAQQINAFFDNILTSSLMDVCAEYSVGGQTIGHGRRVATATITNSEPGTGNTVSDAQIQTALQGWIKSHTIPATTANTLYFVYLPRGVTATFGGNGSSCTQWCGYHNYVGGIFYAVEPYIDCLGCNFTGHDPLSNLTKVSSHELCEAVTNPNDGGWWDDQSGNEIGDLCNGSADVHQLNGWWVQSEWSNGQAACVLAPTAQAAWHRADLTAVTGAPVAAGDPVGYMFDAQGTQHVDYRGSDGHIHELWWGSNGWSHADLTAVTGAPVAAGDPVGYMFDAQGTQHVDCRGLDGHIHELWWG